MDVSKIQREPWHVDPGDGWFSLSCRNRVEPPGIAVRVVRAIQNRTAIWFQHHKPEDVDRRSHQGITPRIAARLSAASVDIDTDRMDRHELVALGGGGCHRVPIASAPGRASDHHAAFQQVHATARRRIAPTPFCTGAAYPFSYAQHRSDGRE